MLTETCELLTATALATLSPKGVSKLAEATQQAKVTHQHKYIVGQVLSGREDLSLLVEEVHQKEQLTMYIKAVAQARQGQWMRWEGVEKRRNSRKDLYLDHLDLKQSSNLKQFSSLEPHMMSQKPQQIV